MAINLAIHLKMFIDLKGHTYGRWAVLEFAGRSKHRFAQWKCRCQCGAEKIVTSNELRTGNSKSCGCLQRETARRIGISRVGIHVGKRTHGMYRTPEYGAYHSARQRCGNDKCEAYPDYGGRGIKFKFDSFKSFLSEVGLRPSDEHSLDRINNNGHYEPGNLRWATTNVQLANRRVKRLEDFSMAELLAEVKRRSWTETVEGYLREGKTVSGGKGDSTLKQQELAQANFTNTLQANYASQFAQQKGILTFLQNKLEPQINNPTGYDAKTLATMRTSATDTTANQFANSEKALNTALTARTGATTLPSGVDAQLQAGNYNAAAASQVEGQNNVTMADANLKNANYWNSVNALSGNAAQFNPTGFSNSANSSAGETADLGSAFKASQNSQLMSTLGGIAGGVASGFGGGLAKKI